MTSPARSDRSAKEPARKNRSQGRRSEKDKGELWEYYANLLRHRSGGRWHWGVVGAPEELHAQSLEE